MSNHWCWWQTPAGNNTALDDFEAMKAAYPDAYAKTKVTMERVTLGQARSGVSQLKGKLQEISSQDGAIFLRVYFLKLAPHYVGVFVKAKKQNKADQKVVTRFEKLATRWNPVECQGAYPFANVP